MFDYTAIFNFILGTCMLSSEDEKQPIRLTQGGFLKEEPGSSEGIFRRYITIDRLSYFFFGVYF